MLLLGLSFFVLSSNHKKNILDEIYFLVKHVGFSYHDLLKMPTFERKYFIDKLIEQSKK
jgi:hypothetical protein